MSIAMFGRSRARSVGLGLILALAAGSAQGQIAWKSGQEAGRAIRPATAASLTALAARADMRHAVLEFGHPLSAEQRRAVEATGIVLLSPLGPGAFFASLPVGLDAAAALQAAPGLRARPIDTAWKLEAGLRDGQIPTWAMVSESSVDGAVTPENPIVGVYVMLHGDVPNDARAIDVVGAHGGLVRTTLQSINAMVVEMPFNQIPSLAAEDSVQWIEAALPRMDINSVGMRNDSNRALVGADTAQGAYGLDGTGVTVLVYDGGNARTTHVDFGGRDSDIDFSGDHYHSTHVAATIGGSGAANLGVYRGMAPNVQLLGAGFEYDGSGTFLYTNPGDIEDDYGLGLSMGANLTNNSIGTNTEPNGFPCSYQGNYGLTSATIDAIVRGSLGGPMIVVWANGNERQGSRCDVEGYGDFYSTAPPACAKNHITVGALNSNDDSMTSFSSWGPTDEGRIKPDVSAPGCQSNGDGGVTSANTASDTSYTTLCGTSMASPTTCGIVALMLEDFRVQFPAQPDPMASTVKALLAHSAVDGYNVGPDYQYGYGSIRAVAAIDLMRTGHFDESEISQGQARRYTATVPGGGPFKVTVAWSDAPATPNVFNALVNDLDLVVTDPNGTRHYPWTLNPTNPSAPAVRTQEDHLNNIEQVLVDSAIGGAWTIEVVGTNVPEGPQSFSIVADQAITTQELLITLPGGVPASQLPQTPTSIDVEIAIVNDTLVANSEQLHYRTTGGGAYTVVALADNGGGSYKASLPGVNCDDVLEFYISAEGVTTGVVNNPSAGAGAPYTILIGQTVLFVNDEMETDQGWTVGAPGDAATTGIWNRADPEGTGAQPEDDHTAAGTQCWVTDSRAGTSIGTWDIDGGATTLISPVYDLSGASGATASYYRWYSNDQGGAPNADIFVIDITNDGTNWVNVETIGPAGLGTSGGWQYHEFNVEDFVALSSTVRLRFVASDLGTGSIVEAALDDLTISRFECVDAPSCAADFDGDGDADGIDVGLFLQAYGTGSLDADLDGDGDTDGIDVGLFLQAYGTGC